MDLCDIGNIRKILKRSGLWAKRSLGQHFLVDTNVLSKIIGAANISSKDYVIEVGPGLGTLTTKLCEKADKVLAVEKDRTLISVLKETTSNCSNLDISNADILRLTDEELGIDKKQKYKVVANLPYYVTSPILQYFLGKENKPQLLVLMVQKEVGMRIVAGPGELSVLAISVQIYGKPEIITQVLRSSFFPEPQVDSALIRITPYNKLFIEIADKKLFFRIVKAGYSERRKQLHNALDGGLAIDEAKIKKILDDANVNPTWRAEDLSLLDWKRIYDLVEEVEKI